MNSPFANLFSELQERIKTEVPAIRWIDQDVGQLENYGDRPPVSFPCVLIDMDAFTYDTQGALQQSAEGEITFRLAFAPRSHTNQLTPAAWKEEALKYYELEWELYRCLMGWKASGWKALIRKSAATERREDPIRVRELRFTTGFTDRSIDLPYTPFSPGDFSDDFSDDFGGAGPELVLTT